MHVQMLSFRLTRGGESASARFTSAMELAVGDYPGLVDAHWVAGHTPVAIHVWEDAAALARFRHSELYAKLVLCPRVEAVEERSFAALGASAAAFAFEPAEAFASAA